MQTPVGQSWPFCLLHKLYTTYVNSSRLLHKMRPHFTYLVYIVQESLSYAKRVCKLCKPVKMTFMQLVYNLRTGLHNLCTTYATCAKRVCIICVQVMQNLCKLRSTIPPCPVFYYHIPVPRIPIPGVRFSVSMPAIQPLIPCIPFPLPRNTVLHYTASIHQSNSPDPHTPVPQLSLPKHDSSHHNDNPLTHETPFTIY